MTPNPTAEKAALRAEMIKQLRQITADDREALSEEICERVLEMTEWNEARNIVLFSPLPSEPIITPLKLDCDARKVSCANIPQGAKSEVDLHLPETIDLILVPGLAFSEDGHRLGRGGGFFDRLLAGRGASAFKLAICFSFQVLPQIPIQEHDIHMNTVVTEKGLQKPLPASSTD